MTWLWILLSGLVLTVIGTLAYTGRGKSWAFRGGYRVGFLLFYAGLGLLLAAVCSVWQPVDPTGLSGIGILLAILLVWVAIVSAFWLPKFLLPRWFRELQAQRKSVRAEVKRAKARDREWKARRRDGTPPDRGWLH